MKLKSYSQHGEDDFIWKYFNKRNSGLVIEVGAFDGIHLSNSYALENLGWNSICVEASPVSFKQLISNRPNSMNYNVAIVGDEDMRRVDFIEEDLGLLSGIDIDLNDVKKRYEKRGLDFKTPKIVKVKGMTLNALLSENDVIKNQIDCISIDVEGYELEVLRGFNIENYMPKMVLIEANNESAEKSLINYFTDKKYKLIEIIGCNLIFIPVADIYKTKVDINCIPMNATHPKGEKYSIKSVSSPAKIQVRNSNLVHKIAVWLKRLLSL